MRAVFLLMLLVMAPLIAGCSASTKSRATKTLATHVEGIDQFDEGDIWALRTQNGTFVVDETVDRDTKIVLYQRLHDTAGSEVIIEFEDIPAKNDCKAYRNVRRMKLDDDWIDLHARR